MSSPNYLYIDSKNRTSGTSSAFIINLNPAVKDVDNVTLLSSAIPITGSTINSSNNAIYFSDGTNNFVGLITPGVYNINNIIPAIVAAMSSTAYSGTISVAYNSIENTFSVTASTPIKFTFGTNTLNSFAPIFGFNNVDTSLATTLTANNVSDLSIPPSLFLNIAELPASTQTASGFNANFTIIINVNSGYINFNNCESHFKQQVSFNNKINLSRLSVTLLDARTLLPYNLNGADFIFLLQMNQKIF